MKRKIIFRSIFILLALYLLIDGGMHVYDRINRWINPPKPVCVNGMLTPAQLQEDFRVFRTILDSVHPGLYRYNDKKSLNAYFDSIAATLDRPMSKLDFYKALRPAAARLRCAHTDVNLSDSLWDSLRVVREFSPVRLCMIGGNVRVNGFPIGNGNIVDSINNEPVAQVLRKLRTLEMVDGFNDEAADAHIFDRFTFDYWLLYGDRPNNLDVCFSTHSLQDGKRSGFCPGNETFEPRFLSLAYRKPSVYDFVIVDSLNTGILTIPTFNLGNQAADAFQHFIDHSFDLLRLKKINQLIIDLRCNEGGANTCEAHLRSYFIGQTCPINETVLFKNKTIACKKYLDLGYFDADQADYFIREHCTRNDSGWYVQKTANECTPAAAPYNGKVIIMVNGQTNSAAARFSSLMQSSGRARIWGSSTTGGRYSSNAVYLIHFLLPNSRLGLQVPAAFADYGIPHTGSDSISGVVPDLPYAGPEKLSDFNSEGELKDLLRLVDDEQKKK